MRWTATRKERENSPITLSTNVTETEAAVRPEYLARSYVR